MDTNGPVLDVQQWRALVLDVLEAVAKNRPSDFTVDPKVVCASLTDAELLQNSDTRSMVALLDARVEECIKQSSEHGIDG